MSASPERPPGKRGRPSTQLASSPHLQLAAERGSDGDGPLPAGSTPASRLRTVQKYVHSAEHRLAEALRHHRALLTHRAELDLITAELQKLVAEDSVTDGVVAEGLYSRSETERLLQTYLSDREAAGWTRRALDWRDVGDSHEDSFGDDSGRAGLEGIENPGLNVLKPPRSRSVFGRPVAVPSSGKLDGSLPPRGPGSQVSAMLRRADLQQAMRHLPPRAAQVLFLRAVGDMEFKEVGGVLEVSAQAVHKAYGKALGDLAEALNGQPPTLRRENAELVTARGRTSRLAELRARRDELRAVVAELIFWQRRAKRMEALLDELRPRLEQAFDEVESQASAA
jgi:predicted DNA-binding protein (UPF0251 family)